MQGRATVLHAFDAQGPEELSAYAGEQVGPPATYARALCQARRLGAPLPVMLLQQRSHTVCQLAISTMASNRQ